VVPTDAGERLLREIGPRFDDIDAALKAVGDLREKPAGTIRLTATENAASSVLMPALERVLPDYPDINVEIVIDFGLTDIVADRFDAGVRMGETVAEGMIAVPIGPELRMAVVGSPTYFEKRTMPTEPKHLSAHSCINLRIPKHGGLYPWEFEKDGRELIERVEGQLVFGNSHLMLAAARAGLGLAYLTEQQVADDLTAGVLVRTLEDWCPPFPGYHLYYPSRRQHTQAFSLILEALRYRSPN
jgi:DNA-binding transcriptional LysR family regulator